MAEITDHLREAIINLCWAAVPYGEDEDGWITRYLIGSGWVHQLVGAAQGAGIPAAFRAIGHELTGSTGVVSGPERDSDEGGGGVPVASRPPEQFDGSMLSPGSAGTVDPTGSGE